MLINFDKLKVLRKTHFSNLLFIYCFWEIHGNYVIFTFVADRDGPYPGSIDHPNVAGNLIVRF